MAMTAISVIIGLLLCVYVSEALRLRSFMTGRRSLPPIMSTLSANKLSFFATTASGLENTLATELKRINGIVNVKQGKGTVSFEGDVRSGLESLMWLRTPLKLMERISSTNNIQSKAALYDWISDIDWFKMMGVHQTLKCDTVLGRDVCPDLDHTHFSSLTVKNAIVDQLRNLNPEQLRPSVELEDPDLPLFLYLHRTQGTLYRVWSGEQSLHKRGYRPTVTHKAALRETTAAALLLNTEWQALCREFLAYPPGCAAPPTLCDPMCGSGTFLVEAALMAADCAPGLLRYHTPPPDTGTDTVTVTAESTRTVKGVKAQPGPTMGAETPTVTNKSRLTPNPLRWADLQASARLIWQDLYQDAMRRDRRASLRKSRCEAFIYGNDLHDGSVSLARQAAQNAQVDHLIDLSVGDIAGYRPPRPPRVYVTNPPWAQRLEGADVAAAQLRTFVHSLHQTRTMTAPSALPVSSQDSHSEGAMNTKIHNINNNNINIITKHPSSMWLLSGGEATRQEYLPGRPAAFMKLSAAGTDMSFKNYLI